MRLLLTATFGLPEGVVTELKTIPHNRSTQTAINTNIIYVVKTFFLHKVIDFYLSVYNYD